MVVTTKRRGAPGCPFGPGWNGRRRAEVTPPTAEHATPDAAEVAAAAALGVLRCTGASDDLSYAQRHAKVEGRELKLLLRSKYQLDQDGVPEREQLKQLAASHALSVKGVRTALKRARGGEEEVHDLGARPSGRPRLLADADVQAAAEAARKVPQKANWFRAALGALKERGVAIQKGQHRTLRRRLKEVGFRARPQDVYPELTPQVRPLGASSAER